VSMSRQLVELPRGYYLSGDARKELSGNSATRAEADEYSRITLKEVETAK